MPLEKISNIPPFEETLVRFREFLASGGYPTELLWVFHEDVIRLFKTGVPSMPLCLPKMPTLLKKCLSLGVPRAL